MDDDARAVVEDVGDVAQRAQVVLGDLELAERHGGEVRVLAVGVVLPFSGETPSDAELRIAEAQLVGWLEGLFHGIQATLFTQQIQAQRQFEEMRGRRSLDMGTGAGTGTGAERVPGAYL